MFAAPPSTNVDAVGLSHFVDRPSRLLDPWRLSAAQYRIAFVERSLTDGGRRQPMLFLHFGIQAVDRERVSIDDLVNSFRIYAALGHKAARLGNRKRIRYAPTVPDPSRGDRSGFHINVFGLLNGSQSPQLHGGIPPAHQDQESPYVYRHEPVSCHQRVRGSF